MPCKSVANVGALQTIHSVARGSVNQPAVVNRGEVAGWAGGIQARSGKAGHGAVVIQRRRSTEPLQVRCGVGGMVVDPPTVRKV